MSTFGHWAAASLIEKVSAPRDSTLSQRAPRLALWALASIAPDLDLLLKSKNEESYHRGFSHSLSIALFGGAVIGILARKAGRDQFKNTLVASAVLASHGLLDAASNESSTGVKLLWPFNKKRYLFRYRPIPAASMEILFSLWGAWLMIREILFYLPVWIYSFDLHKYFQHAKKP